MAVKTLDRTGLVSEWKLDGNALETSGAGNNGTATSMTYGNTNRGYQAQSAIFNGTSGKIVSGSTTTINGNFTISTWINSSKTHSSQNSTIIDVGNFATPTGFGIWIGSGGTANRLTWRINSVYDNYTAINFPVTNGVNYHLVMRYDGVNVKFYINNILISTIAHTTNPLGSSLPTTLGVRENGTEWYGGTQQGTRVYNIALSDFEIQTLYFEGMRKLTGNGLLPLMDGLVAYYDFNGDAQDIIGGNNGTVTAATLTTDRFGVANRAYDFNGTTAIISAGGVAITGDYTVQGICRFDTIGTGATERYIFRLHQSGTSILYFMTYQDKWYIYHSGGAVTLQPSSPVPVTATDYYWGITFTGSTLTLYINGVSVATAGSASALGANNTLDIGGRTGAGFMDGKYETIKFLNRALSASEMLVYYQIESTRYLTPLFY